MTSRNVPGLYRYGISMNKLYDYMAAARPVVVAIDAANNPYQRSRMWDYRPSGRSNRTCRCACTAGVNP
jgi:hypothetical protein